MTAALKPIALMAALCLALTAAPAATRDFEPAGVPALAVSTIAGPAGRGGPVAQEAPAAGPVVVFGRAIDLVGTPLMQSRSKERAFRWSGQSLAARFDFQGGGWRTPLGGGYLTSRFGMRKNPVIGVVQRHAGIDIAAAYGTPIHASANGLVAAAGWRGGYGLSVDIDHGGGVTTRYAHLSQIAVSPGQPITTGEIIGAVGSTGRSTGNHLHFEIRSNGQAFDPLPYLRRP